MIDIGKIADLVLLVIDANFGFEMETFEFLNILQSHGFPKVIGVLTHLDKIKRGREMKKKIKKLRRRFWEDVCDGAKLFSLTAIVHGRLYPKNEIHTLCRYISIQKFRPIIWRNSHSFVLVDRVEDVTEVSELEESNKCDRRVCFYGYLRGTSLKAKTKVHVAGSGDYYMKKISLLQDPCPSPLQITTTET